MPCSHLWRQHRIHTVADRKKKRRRQKSPRFVVAAPRFVADTIKTSENTERRRFFACRVQIWATFVADSVLGCSADLSARWYLINISVTLSLSLSLSLCMCVCVCVYADIITVFPRWIWTYWTSWRVWRLLTWVTTESDVCTTDHWQTQRRRPRFSACTLIVSSVNSLLGAFLIYSSALTHSVLTAIFPGEAGLAGYPLNSPSPCVPELRVVNFPRRGVYSI